MLCMKKNSNDLETADRKKVDTELNKWIKSLDRPKKRIFYDKLWSNDLLWLARPLTSRKIMFNNYRYEGLGMPLDFNMILIWITALYADPKLKITDIFPEINEEYIDPNFKLTQALVQRSLETNNFNRGYVKDKKKQFDY